MNLHDVVMTVVAVFAGYALAIPFQKVAPFMPLLPFFNNMPAALSSATNDNQQQQQFELVDMSHTFDNTTVYWPSFELKGEHFALQIEIRGNVTWNGRVMYHEANNFSAPEHGGTHIDAPAHFVEHAWRVEQIPLEQLIGPAISIDMRAQASADTDYLLTADDVRAWEKENGKIEAGTIAFVHTGFGRFWPDRRRYIGFDGRNESDLHFPGISQSAAQLFVERGVKAVGIDTASPDNMKTKLLVHVVLLSNNVLIIENVANVDKLPARGAYVVGLPMKIGGGSGGPVRMIAQVPVMGVVPLAVMVTENVTLSP